MEIKLDFIELMNKKRELEERNERARAYSASVSRKAKETRENILFVIAPFAILGFLYVLFNLTMHLCVWIGGMI